MKAVIQRVTNARVSVDGEIVASIGRGLCVLIGIKRDDTSADAEYMVRKILNIKIFDGEDGKRWSTSVMERNYEVLCISQFTLYHVIKGNKLDFHRAMPAKEATVFYSNFVEELGKKYKSELIKDGRFGAAMQVNIENDGPMTLELESPVKENTRTCVLQKNNAK